MGRYKSLTEQEAVVYAKEKLDIFPRNAKLVCEEIGTGNLNLIFRIKDLETNKSVVFKQALPYLRVVGESWPLTLDRARIEAEAIQLEEKICPGFVPKIYLYDQDLALIAMEDLSYLNVMRFELMKMKHFPKFPKQVGEFLAKTMFYTSDIAMDPIEKKGLTKKFINPELCKITEDLILTDPFHNAKSNRINPELLEVVKMFWKKWEEELRLEVTKLKESFVMKAQSLLHGDLHTGSIFVDEERMKIFDAEFAFYGPAGFDIALTVGNIILNYASWEGRDDVSKEKKVAYRDYLLTTVEELYHEFEKCFNAAWEQDAREEYASVKGYKEYYMRTLFQEMAGFSGCVMIRRVIGLAHVADLDSIEDLKKRAIAQRLALRLGEAVIMNRNNIVNIENYTEIIRNVTQSNDAHYF